MANAQLTLALQHLRQLIRQGAAAELPDTALLERFVGQRDEAAFEVLVWRHGPMVLSLCQRLLHNPHDAEDVLQATFLTLARKAGSIRKRESLGSWLYKVAYRIALHAKARAANSGAAAGAMQDVPAAEGPDEDVWQQVRPLLDEAIQRLPEKYRTPIVLCYLQGKTNREAAAQIGCPIGTVCTRLARARGLLRRQLARHGVALSAALLGTVLSRHAVSAAASTPLVVSTVKAACLLAAGQTGAAGLISANVASLVQGASKAMFLTKLKITAVLLLAAGVVAAGAGVLTHRAVAARQADSRQSLAARAPDQAVKSAAPKKAARPEVAKDDGKSAVAFAGLVLDPDGKPFAGAKLCVLYDTLNSLPLPVRGTTGKDGRFRFNVARTDFDKTSDSEPWRNTSVVALADGYGLGFEIPRPGKKPQSPTNLMLRLTSDDLPASGRVLDLEGKPIAGVRLSVRGIEAPLQEDLRPFVAALKSRKEGGVIFDFLRGFMGPMGSAVGQLFPPATTGADGRFRIKNVGRERVVVIRIEGPSIETQEVDLMTRREKTIRVPMERNYRAGGSLTFQGIPFDHVAAPSRPIVGVVRDKDTGKPLAGAVIESSKRAGEGTMVQIDLRTVAGPDGRYRLTGMPKGNGNIIRASPPKGEPYLMALKSVPDGSGLDPVTTDFELKRGVWITGQLTDKATGKPVHGCIDYYVFADNPYRREAHGLTTNGSHPHRADDDTFRVVGLPGRGLIAAHAWNDGYVAGAGADKIKGFDPQTGLLATYPYLCHAKSYHRLVEVNPEKDAVLVTCPVVLDPGRTLPGTVLGPDGKPLAGAWVSGLTSMGYWAPQPLKTAEFKATGFVPGQRRLLMCIHEGKHLAGFLVAKGDQKGPLTVKLQPWGVVKGRLVDADGQPRAGMQLMCGAGRIRRRPVPTAGTPDELSFGSRPSQMSDLRTDKHGKLGIDALIPGLRYNIEIMEEGYRITGYVEENLMVKPGEVKDLGDVKADPTGG
ncbi:MAG TPA: sigma-70 family RNA polymerase sigma factor [Gemmataceae bacterium]|nr:sigma-70 family RNA polymerase sigma factor [Gemmataceae bacterium]